MTYFSIFAIIIMEDNMLTISLLLSLLLFTPQEFINLYNYSLSSPRTQLCYIT